MNIVKTDTHLSIQTILQHQLAVIKIVREIQKAWLFHNNLPYNLTMGLFQNWILFADVKP